MKIIYAFLLVFNFAFISESGFAQFQVHSIQISLDNLLWENISAEHSTSYYLLRDTTITTFPMNIFQTMDNTFDGKILHFTYSEVPNKYNNWSPTHATINLSIDPYNKIMNDLTLSYIDTIYTMPGQPSSYYYDSYGESVHLQSLPFIYSLKKDTISVQIVGSQLKENILSATIDTDYTQSIHLYGHINSTLIGIPDSALLIVKIIGNGPLLSVYNNDETSSESATNFNHTNKTIILKNLSKKREETFCYDLLGRKHNLDFISTDGTSTTYSIRSLPPGVYFVSDGKEMVKFLISN
jgi:hypothetical protein